MIWVWVCVWALPPFPRSAHNLLLSYSRSGRAARTFHTQRAWWDGGRVSRRCRQLQGAESIGAWDSQLSRCGMTENPPYLLKALHQRERAFDLVHLPCPVQGLFDDVAEVIVVLQERNDGSERYTACEERSMWLHVCHMASRLAM